MLRNRGSALAFKASDPDLSANVWTHTKGVNIQSVAMTAPRLSVA